MSTRLEELRGELESVSSGIVERLNERARLVLRVCEEKRRLGLPVRDPRRESVLLERLVHGNDGPFSDAAVRSIFRHVLDASVDLMETGSRAGLRVGADAGPRVVVSVRGHAIGGDAPAWIAGPCSVESAAQIDETAERLSRLGVGFLRGGAFKPRTSPYAFQGLGEPALRMLREAASRHGMATITEATSPGNVGLVAEYADVIQVGARNMYNYELLRVVGRTGKPVLLKRGFSATLDEWLHAAEYVALAGSERIILCERGIRTFAREYRATLDLAIVPLALAGSRLPVVVDVSHAAGRRDLLVPLAAAALGVGAQGVMIEVHPDPDVALSDAEQQLDIDDFAALQVEVASRLAAAAGAVRGDNEIAPARERRVP
nr:protein AroA(G) [uncultured bacterium]